MPTRLLHFIACLILIVSFSSCASMNQLTKLTGVDPKKMAIAEGGSYALVTACEKTKKIKSCDNIGEAFKKYIYGKKDESAAYCSKIVKANGGTAEAKIKIIVQSVDIAARLAGKYGSEVKEFSKFMAKVFDAQGGDDGNENEHIGDEKEYSNKFVYFKAFEAKDEDGESLICIEANNVKPKEGWRTKIKGIYYYCVTAEKIYDEQGNTCETGSADGTKGSVLFKIQNRGDYSIYANRENFSKEYRNRTKIYLTPGLYTIKIEYDDDYEPMIKKVCVMADEESVVEFE